jgi:release factor glutamine methyltransferase
LKAYLSPGMTIREQYHWLSEQLQQLYDKGEADTIAEWVLLHYTGLNRTSIKMHGNKPVTMHEKQQISHAANELMKTRPIQYVLEEAWFKGMRFYVNEDVLIPRPETEELVNWALDVYENNETNISILDIGTGSGCIAISMAKGLPAVAVTAIDVSEGALAIAQRNATDLHATVDCRQMDFLQEINWAMLPAYDCIISNPPYIPLREKEKLDANVTAWEPGTALFVPNDDALLFYRKIALFGKTHLLEGGNIFFECHQQFARDTLQMLQQMGYKTEMKKDIFNNERMIRAWSA